LTLLLLGFALVPAAAPAAEPPNQNDPCSRNGRDSCKTTGVGQYKTYRYGLRWFGDYRNVVPGVKGPMFCIDLRYWYPSRSFGFAERPADTALRNREGDVVSAASLRKMSYAIWRHGQTNDRVRQGAVMLYVHRLMGDGAPGEVDPAAVGDAVRSTYDRVARESARFAGPYRLQTSVSPDLAVRKPGMLTVRVVAASGAAVPDVGVSLDLDGVRSVPAAVKTGSDGMARIPFSPNDAKGGVRGTVRTEPMAATRPAIYVPTRADAARNGQRLAAAATTAMTAKIAAPVEAARIAVTTEATPNVLLAGEASRDKVLISGAPGGWRADVEVRLFGPFRSQAAISCAAAPFATTTYSTFSGPSLTPPLIPPGPGWYGYQLVIPSSDDVIGLTTPCGEPSETFKVETQPKVVTQVSAPVVSPGTPVTDTVAVTDLSGETVTVAATLHGPYAAPDKITCEGPPVWSGSFQAAADGSYVTDPVTLTVPGYYTYRESIVATDFVRAVQTPCAEVAETVLVRGRPAITTQVSAQETAPGASITDSVVVTGLGALAATVNVELWGPFATRQEIRCEGTPFATAAMPVPGDGTFMTAPVTLTKAGYYTYRESIVGTDAYDGVVTACGEVSETTFTRAKPDVTTVVSSAIARPGAEIFDRIKVTGLGQTPATIEVRLFGPFASRSAISCSGTPVWRGTVDVNGDGEFNSDKVRLTRAGFYTYQERIRETPTIAGTQGVCAEESETSLAAPLILTGRGEGEAAAAGRRVVTVSAGTETATVRPVRVQVARAGVDARIYGVDIDTRSGALAIPKNIDRVGWWRDGAAPGSSTGAILLAGHVDSAKAGAGAFYGLRNARSGDSVSVMSSDGKTRRYRVTSVRRVGKSALPMSIFSRSGPRRLVLVTCGGPFDAARGVYRDNIIVTARPR